MAAHIQQSSSSRIMVLAVIVAFHVLLVWGLASGLARKVVEVIAPPLETDLIEEIKDEAKPPPPPPPEMERPPVEVPPPDVAIDIPVDTSSSTAITDVTDKPVPKAPPPPPPPRSRSRAGLDTRRPQPDSEEYYPSRAKRDEVEGRPIITLCVGANNKLTREPTVQTSSGSADLDQGAIRYGKALRLKAGSEDGQPLAEDCFNLAVKFQLKKE
jgi:protein TonB